MTADLSMCPEHHLQCYDPSKNIKEPEGTTPYACSSFQVNTCKCAACNEAGTGFGPLLPSGACGVVS